MSERIQELEFSVTNQDKSRSNVVVRFILNESGELIRIEGDGPQHGYVGKLTLKGTTLKSAASNSKSGASEEMSEVMSEEMNLEEGGTDCLVCKNGYCEVEVPCTSCD